MDDQPEIIDDNRALDVKHDKLTYHSQLITEHATDGIQDVIKGHWGLNPARVDRAINQFEYAIKEARRLKREIINRRQELLKKEKANG